MAESEAIKISNIRARVEDYIDDKIQTTPDLDNVEGLLSRVQQQQDLLNKQLGDARQKLSETKTTVDNKSSALRQRIEDFQTQQRNIDHHLKILTQSEVSDDATKKIESRMTKVRNLEVAHGYLELLQQVETLSKRAREHLASQPEISLRNYIQLRDLWKEVQEAQPAAEGAASQLLYLFEQAATQLYRDLKDILGKRLQQTLDQMKWPSKELNLIGNTVEIWQQQVELLLELQEPDLLKNASDRETLNANIAPDPVNLLPLEIMVQPLAARFRYHFYGERPTNRLDKPEYFLSHILDLIEQHAAFFTDMLGPILDERVLRLEALETVYTDAVSAYITALLPMVNAKCLSFLPQIMSEPQLLSHFIREIMAFDSSIRSSWVYVPIPRVLSEWRGVTWSVLDTHGYFQPWLTVEKDFALSRYMSIRDAFDSREVDFDAEPGQTKPTKGAFRVNELLETITDRYRGLSSFSYKMKFLLEIQLSVFDDYHNYLHDALQKYIAESHTAGRLIQGQYKTEAFELSGLESLTKIFGSAEYLERKMSDWSDDLFFLELWDELLSRSKATNGTNTSIGKNLKVDEVAARTSSTIKANGSDNVTENDGSGLFDQTASAYRRLRERSEEQIIRVLDVNVRNALKAYAKQAQWSTLGNASFDSATLTSSSALESLFQTTTVFLGYLTRAFAPGALRRVTKHFCASVQRELYDNVLMYHTFSAAGAAQLKRDLSAIEESVEKTTKLRGAIGSNMKRIEEAVFLLGLPVKSTNDGNEKDDWGFEDEDQTSNTEAIETTEDAVDAVGWSLLDIDKRVFESNEAARSALGALGLFHLSEVDARKIIKQRVELNR